MSIGVNNPFIFNKSAENPISPSQQAQSAIREGDLGKLEQILGSLAVNAPLPNGELPLHFAVREGKQELTSALLKAGAELEKKDYQGLSALDHAALLQDRGMLYTLLGPKLGAALKDGERESSTSLAASTVETLEKQTRETLAAPERTVLAPLHLAAMGNDPDEVNLLVALGADVNAKDIFGNTPLHYAAVNPNGRLFSALLKAGADLYETTQTGVSAVAILGAAISQRDPLRISGAQQAMFLAIVAHCALSLVNTLYAEDMSQEEQWLVGNLQAGLLIAISVKEIQTLVAQWGRGWKRTATCMGMLALSYVPLVRTPLQAWTTYQTARAAFAGLSAAYHNIRYRTWAATRNVAIQAVNTAASAQLLWERASSDDQFLQLAITGYDSDGYDAEGYDSDGWNRQGYNRKGYNEEGYNREGYNREGFDQGGNDRDGYDWAGYDRWGYNREGYNRRGFNQSGYDREGYDSFGYNKFGYDRAGKDRFGRNRRFGHSTGSEKAGSSWRWPWSTGSTGQKSITRMTNEERLTTERLDPNRVDDALQMLSPDFTLDQLHHLGKKLYGKTYRELGRVFHPDKGGSSKVCIRLNQAYETLNEYVQRRT